MMDDDVRELVDLSREEDLDTRIEETLEESSEDSEIKDVDELATESSSLAGVQKPATDQAIFISPRVSDDSEIPPPEPGPEHKENSVEQALATKPPKDTEPIPDAQAEQLTQSVFDDRETIQEVPEQLEVGFNEIVESVEQELRLNVDSVTLYDQEALDPRSLLPEIPGSFYVDGSSDIHLDSDNQMAQERRA
jgi:hypothetical protein